MKWHLELAHPGSDAMVVVVDQEDGSPPSRIVAHKILEELGPEMVHKHIDICETYLPKWKLWAQEDMVKRLSAPARM